MSLETLLYSTLKPLVPGQHVYRDRLDDGESPQRWITFKQVGGQAINFLSGDRPSKKWARVQIDCWGEEGQPRDTITALARAVEDKLVADLAASVEGAFVSVYEPATRRNGTHQDFSFSYDD